MPVVLKIVLILLVTKPKQRKFFVKSQNVQQSSQDVKFVTRIEEERNNRSLDD